LLSTDFDISFRTIGWKFYLALIIPGCIGAVVMYIFFPDTRELPLEEVALIFGDADEVAIYQRDIEIDHKTHAIVDHHNNVEKQFEYGTEHIEHKGGAVEVSTEHV
jgi:hypothetical protein